MAERHRPDRIAHWNAAGEICGLQWFDLNFERGLIHFRNTKNGKDRLIPMNATVRTLLEERRTRRAQLRLLAPDGARCGRDARAPSSGYVFPSPRTGERLVEIKYSFARAIKDAKITDLRFHDLRPTAATRMGDAGADAFTPGCDLRLVRHSDGDALHPRDGGRKSPSSRSNCG